VIEELRKFPTSIISDCMGRRGAMDPGIKPVVEGLKIVGQAFTVRCGAKDNSMVHKSLYEAKRGDIIVIQTSSRDSVWGAILSFVARMRGIGGVVLDGNTRDISEIRAERYPLFCRGFTPQGSFKRGVGEINIPICCGGIQVNPRDVIIGDDDGVIVLPNQEVKKVLEKAAERVKLEKCWVEEIKRGKTLLELIKWEVDAQKLMGPA